MPFTRVDIVESRLNFVRSVLAEGKSLSSACREFGVSRTTGYKWLARFEQDDLSGLEDRSRRPHSSPRQTPDSVVERILELKKKYPAWGACKLAVLLGESSPCPRTIDRILDRHGWTVPASTVKSVGRFVRENSNELWQMDFKGVPHGNPELLGCVDDASRFCVFLARVPSQRLEDWWPVLWDAFGTYGMPDAILCDNGSSFRNLAMERYSSFDIRLLRLGIRPIHGRPCHPQTQGKIERFFGTLEKEKGIGQPAEFRRIYNEIRPHAGIDMRTPTQCYQPSRKPRPAEMPSDEPPNGSETRRTDVNGVFSYRGCEHKLGKAVRRKRIGILEGDVFYGTANLGPIHRYKL